jgi:peroxin-3
MYSIGGNSLTLFCIKFLVPVVGLCSKPLKEPYTIDDLRDVFMRIRASLGSIQAGWAQYVLPPSKTLDDNNLATASSAVDASQSSGPAPSIEDEEKLEQLVVESRAVLARQVVCIVLEKWVLYTGGSFMDFPSLR